MLLDAFRHLDRVARLHGFVVRDLVAEMDEGFDVGTRNDLVSRWRSEQSLLGFFVTELGLLAFFPCRWFRGGD